MIHAARKSLEEVGDKASDEEKQAVETAITELEGVMQEGDKETIEAKTQTLAEASGKLAEKLYADADGGAGESGGPEAGASSEQDDVVDAEFEEVKDDEKK